MRTSRISQDTTKAISAIAPSPSRRRSTRSSLSRFAHNASSSTATHGNLDDEDATPESDPISDIEDTLLPLKRKRRSTSSIHTSPKPKTDIKTSTSTRRRGARQTTNPTTGALHIEPPPNWETVYDLVKVMRLHGPARPAPVDTMGCERLALLTSSPLHQRYHTLTALMLSSQTKDTTTAATMQRLHTELPACSATSPPGLTLANIIAVEPDFLNNLIWSVGFHNTKTRNIKAAALILRDQHDGDVPDTVEALMALPGVGPKMAYLCLSSAWGRTEGIGVDVHVHRITNLWGWNDGVRGAVKGKGTKGPEETRLALQGWLPRERWREVNWLLVGFGQTVCMPERGRRRCGECEVGLEGLCGSAERGKVLEGRRRRREEKLKMEVEVKGDFDGDGVVSLETEDVVVKEEVLPENELLNGLDAGLEIQGLKDEEEIAVKAEEDAHDGVLAISEVNGTTGRKRRKR